MYMCASLGTARSCLMIRSHIYTLYKTKTLMLRFTNKESECGHITIHELVSVFYLDKTTSTRAYIVICTYGISLSICIFIHNVHIYKILSALIIYGVAP